MSFPQSISALVVRHVPPPPRTILRVLATTKTRHPAVTSRIMSAVRGRDTKPELLLRSLLHRRGLRFRTRSDLPGRPDLIFPAARIAVFVDGDFWHGNAWRVRGLTSFDQQFRHRNAAWWKAKIQRNMKRDDEVNRDLQRAGWRVVRVWESDLLRAPQRVADRVERIIRRHLA